MKHLLIIWIALFHLQCIGQSKIVQDSVLKPGLYFSVEDVIYNRPANIQNLSFDKDSIRVAKNWKRTSMDIYHLNITREQAVRTEKLGGIFGFCDGKNIYLSTTFKQSELGRSFFKAEIICDFINFEGVSTIYVNGRPDPFKQGGYVQNVIDTKKGQFFDFLTKRTFKKVISEKPKLVESFKNQDDKSLHYRAYLQKYCEE